MANFGRVRDNLGIDLETRDALRDLDQILLPSGSVFYVDGSGGANGNDGKSWDKAVATITYALSLCTSGAGDVIYVGPGSYDEAVTVSKTAVTLVGAANRGSAAIAPTATNATALTVTANGTTIINVGCEGDGTGGGVLVQGADRFRAFGSKLEGGAFAVKLESTASADVSDTRLHGCELAWATNGLHFAVTGGGDPVTQTIVDRCLFHNTADRAIFVDTVHTADLWVTNCVIGREEDGTAVAQKLIAADVASTTGLFGNNVLAHATNASAQFAIATGVLWVANMTEAGVTTARPS